MARTHKLYDQKIEAEIPEVNQNEYSVSNAQLQIDTTNGTITMGPGATISNITSPLTSSGYQVVPNYLPNPNTHWNNGNYIGGSAGTPSFTFPSSFPIDDSSEPLTEQERSAAIEFIEAMMFLITNRLDECDVSNRGGLMDRSEGMPLEAIVDIDAEYEIVIRRK